MGLLEPHGRGRRDVRFDALSGPDPGPAIVVYSLTQAVAALEAAAAGNRPITLLSAPDAGIYAGPGWWRALADASREAVPAAEFAVVLDCGDDAGAAQGAFRAGIGAVVFTGRAEVAERLAAIANEKGARLLTARPEPIIDLVSLFFADGETLRRHCAMALGARR